MKKVLLIFGLFLLSATIAGKAGALYAQDKQAQTAVEPAKPAQAAQPTQPAPQEQPASGKDFVIGLEDVLSVNVWKEPELSLKEVVVRPDGKISVPLANDIQASGLTTQQLQDQIAEKLKEFISAPVVTVTVVRISSQSVSIVGEVARPGVYALAAPMTVLELLARAGGVTLDAKTKKIKIIRKEKEKTVQFMFNYNDIKSGKGLETNILLKSGDVVIVP